MTAITPTRPTLSITGWGVVSPWGFDVSSFSEGLTAQEPARRDVTAEFEDSLPATHGYMVSDLVAREHLGRKGVSTLDRTSVLTMISSLEALAGRPADSDRTRFGMVLGTSAGSTRSTSEYSKATYVEDKPYLVNPLIFPNAVMNCAASQTAIRVGLQGVNATIAGGATAVLSVLRYASRLIARGRIDRLLVGATEEFSPQWAWESHYTYGPEAVAAGEGSAMFVVEGTDSVGPDTQVYAEILGTQVVTNDGRRSLTERMRRCLSDACSEAGIAPDDVWAVLSSENGSDTDRDEDAAITAELGPHCRRIRIKELLGEARSASTALQLAAAISLHKSGACPTGSIFIVTARTPEGNVGVSVLRGVCRD